MTVKEENVQLIKEFGTKHGFLDLGFRCKAYMLIFEIDSVEIDVSKSLMDNCRFLAS